MLRIPVRFGFSSAQVETRLRANRTVAEPKIAIFHNSTLQGSVSVVPGAQEIALPKLSVGDRDFELHLTIDFRTKQQSLQVAAVAKVGHPQSIKLVQSSASRMIGTINRLGQFGSNPPRALGAAAIAGDCDISCVPPSKEMKGIGYCVICDCGTGQFELCC